MPKVLFLTFFSFLLSLFLFTSEPETVFAEMKFSKFGTEFTVSHTPLSVTQSSGVNITISTKDDFFADNQNYTLRATAIDDTNENIPLDCSFPKNPNQIHCESSKPDNKTLNFTLKFDTENSRKIGVWKVQLWRGTGTIDRRTGLIFNNYQYTVEQTGGGTPKIFPLYSPVQPNTEIFVVLNSARKDNTYSFWWEGDYSIGGWGGIIHKETVNQEKSSIIISLGSQSGTLEKPKTLCMEVGDYGSPIGLTCKYKTQFVFSQSVNNTQLKCSIIPSRPKTSDDIALQAINLPKNSEFKVSYAGDQGTGNLVSSDNSGDAGAVILSLGNNLNKGTYTAYLYDVENTEVCTQTFSVGSGGSGSRDTSCSPGDPNCSLSAGMTCDPSNGDKDIEPNPDHKGVYTAIGCIPTNPTELIQGLLKIATGAGGAIALLLMIAGVFKIITSSGNPDALKSGQEQITNAVIGLLFIIFSVLLLQIIGVNILSIPGFS